MERLQGREINEKTACFFKYVGGLRIQLYVANACYFIILSVFPMLLLLLGLLAHTSLQVERLGEILEGILPQVLLESAERLILITYDNTTGAALGFSAVTALWSSSKGIYGLMTGLNAIYEVREERSYIRTRLLCVVYTFGFLLLVIMTLGLHVFSSGLLELLEGAGSSIWSFVASVVDVRFFLLLFTQTAFFIAMFMVLPSGRHGFWMSLPGALLASVGWLVFSNLYSIYVERFAGLTRVYGSVYAVALSMLWLYCCVSIVFYGGVLNRVLAKGKAQEGQSEKSENVDYL